MTNTLPRVIIKTQRERGPPKSKGVNTMKNTMTVAELIALLNKVEDKNTTVEFHSISNRAYQDTIVDVKTSKYTKHTTITIK